MCGRARGRDGRSGEDTYTVTLRAVAEPELISQATVVVSPITIQVRPGQVSLAPGGTQGFRYDSTNGTATWSVVEPNGGTITAEGRYTAPLLAGRYTVRASSTVDGVARGEATVFVGSGGPGGGTGGSGSGTGTSGVTLTVTPALAEVDAGMVASFSATVEGSENTAVAWALKDPSPDAAVDGEGTFKATRGGVYTLVATSVADATARVEVTALVNGGHPPGGGGTHGVLAWVLRDGLGGGNQRFSFLFGE